MLASVLYSGLASALYRARECPVPGLGMPFIPGLGMPWTRA